MTSLFSFAIAEMRNTSSMSFVSTVGQPSSFIVLLCQRHTPSTPAYARERITGLRIRPIPSTSTSTTSLRAIKRGTLPDPCAPSGLNLEKILRIDWKSHTTLSKSSRTDGNKASLLGSRFRTVQASVDIPNTHAMIKKVAKTTSNE